MEGITEIMRELLSQLDRPAGLKAGHGKNRRKSERSGKPKGPHFQRAN